MVWELITNIILILSFITLLIFAIIGIVQWVKRGSFEKIDRRLRWMPLPLVLMAITYFIFDKLIILATRPNGSGEPSFPSTHVMVVATIFFLTSMNLPRYVKSKNARIILEVVMVILISLTCIGRVYSYMHSPIDVIFGLIFAFLFTEVYYRVLKKKKPTKAKKATKKHE